MNLLLSRLDEEQRRWYLAVESERLGYGADRILYEITGVDEKTIRRGREELLLRWWTARSTGCACRVAGRRAWSPFPSWCLRPRKKSGTGTVGT